MENKLELLATDSIIENVYRDLENDPNYQFSGWWTHAIFEGKCRFASCGHEDYIEFPNEDMMVMFVLRFGAK